MNSKDRKTCLLSVVTTLFTLVIIVSFVIPVAAQRRRADALFRRSQKLLQESQFQKALEALEAAVPLYRKAGEPLGEAGCLTAVGSIKERLSDYDGALTAYRTSMTIYQSNELLDMQVMLRTYIGNALARLGRFDEALTEFKTGLSLSRKVRMPKGYRKVEGKTRASIGSIYVWQGRYQEALRWYEQGLAIAREIGDQLSEAASLSVIGQAYASLGLHRKALDRLLEGQQLLDAIVENGAYSEYETLNLREMQIFGRASLGGMYLKLNLLDQALTQYKAMLSVSRKSGFRGYEGLALNNLCRAYTEIGNYDEALANCSAGLDFGVEIGDLYTQAITLSNIGIIHTVSREYEQAEAYQGRALAVAQELGVREVNAAILGNISYLHFSRGNTDKSIEFLKKSVESTESVQEELVIEELASAFASSHVGLYKNLIHLLERSGDKAAAFSYAERARARAFLSQIGNQQVDFRRGTANELINEEREVRQQIAGLQNAFKTERAKPLARQSRLLIDRLTANLEQARKNYEALLTRLKLASPEYASLVSVDTLSLAEVQQQVLDEQTTLIEYFVLEDRTMAWVIEREGFELIPLDITENDLRNKVTYLRNLIADRDFDRETAANLYISVFSPLKPYIRHRNLIIVPHGVLHYLPFAALWDAEKERYLLQDYTLTYAPSASVLRFLQDKLSEDKGRLLALGNPDGSLPHAATETKAIADLYGTTALLGRQATESQVREQAGQLDVLHLAAHGVYTPLNPLFSRIELAGDEQADGNLEVHEVFGLDLTGTNLVVLSACKTALGQQSEGDEIVGLTRAFLYAGTPAVVTTLWAINSEASGALMEAFYRHLRDGETTAEALQTAQLEVLEEDQWETPYFWAAFSLTGGSQGSWESD